eukprot:920343-Prymnesium_polylepis.1
MSREQTGADCGRQLRQCLALRLERLLRRHRDGSHGTERVEALEGEPDALARCRVRVRLRTLCCVSLVESARRRVHGRGELCCLEPLDTPAYGAQPSVTLCLVAHAKHERLVVAAIKREAAIHVVARVTRRAHSCDRRIEKHAWRIRVVDVAVVPLEVPGLEHHSSAPPPASQAALEQA